MEPLVDQIENEIEFDDYKSYINQHLAQCIGNFASCCTNDDGLIRKFNYQILLKTKHNSIQVLNIYNCDRKLKLKQFNLKTFYLIL